jgi:hypothetical protein
MPNPLEDYMASMSLRTPDDVRRLFSALGDDLTHEDGALSIAQIDEMALSDFEEPVDGSSLGLTLLVAVATGWAAIKGYERNDESMGWGLTWASLGYLFPIPAVIYSAVKN